MTKQIIFAISFLATLGVFFYTINRIVRFFRLTRPAFPVKDFRKRITVMLSVAFGQTKIFRKPVIGFFHALVFWGFCVIIFGSLEMVIDGLTGTDRVLKSLGSVYNIIIASGDIFALLVAISIIIFLSRRLRNIIIDIATRRAKISPEAIIILYTEPRDFKTLSVPVSPSITISRLPNIITQNPQKTRA